MEHPLLKAVVELAEHPVEQVLQRLQVPVPSCPPAQVVGVRASSTAEGDAGPQVDDVVELEERHALMGAPSRRRRLGAR